MKIKTNKKIIIHTGIGFFFLLAFVFFTPWSKFGGNILLWSAQNGYTTVTKTIVYLGAPVDYETEHKETAFILSAKRGDIEAVQFLTENSANINHQDRYGYTAIMLVSSSDYENEKIVKYLLSRWDIHIDLKSDLGYTALDFARHLIDTQISKMLVAKSREFSYIIYSSFF
jgi:ankyrin repeat protein